MEAIRSWEERQQKKNEEKGLFALMEERNYGTTNNHLGLSKDKPKEIIRTIYFPAREKKDEKPISRSGASTELPPCTKKVIKRIYPNCPSPDPDYEIKKLTNRVEYTEGGKEFSVDRPTVVQSSRRSSLSFSSEGMGTLFAGYSNEDFYEESDEINLAIP